MLRARAQLLSRRLGAAPPARTFRASPPAQIVGPFVAGVGVALVAYSAKLLLQATSNPKFREAMRDAASPSASSASASASSSADADAAASRAAPARGSTASYFTTDAMGVALGQGASEWGGACAAVVEGGAPRVVENDHGQRRTPSVVAFADSGETLVGQPAKKLLFSRTATAVRGFEAILGVRHDSDECRRLIAEAALPYALAADDRGFAAVQVIARARLLSPRRSPRAHRPPLTHRHTSPVQVLATLHPPAELSAAVIEALRRASESALGGRSVLSAAIGAPALASDALRDALVAAGRRAGLQQIEIVDEHLAAARAAEHELPAALADARTLGVYDLGARAFSFGVLAAPTAPTAAAAAAAAAAGRWRRRGARRCSGRRLSTTLWWTTWSTPSATPRGSI